MELPRLNKFLNVRMLVNSTVVHHDNRVWGRKRLHVVEESSDKCCEGFRAKGTLNYAAMQEPVLKRQSGENRKALQ
jgi:hypothetical protein